MASFGIFSIGRASSSRRRYAGALALGWSLASCGPLSVSEEGSALPYDAGGPVDSSTAGPAADASSCHPGTVQTFAPKPYVPAAPPSSVCSIQDIQNYYAACIDPKTASTVECAGFANTDCAHCITTPDSAKQYGPLVSSGGLVRANVAGCLQLVDPGRLSCANALQGRAACELTACAANCPVSSDPDSLAAYRACAAAADLGGCEGYVDASACFASLSVGADAVCDATAFGTYYNNVVPLFCGPPMSGLDADTDGGVAAEIEDGAASNPGTDAEDGTDASVANMGEDAATADATILGSDGGAVVGHDGGAGPVPAGDGGPWADGAILDAGRGSDASAPADSSPPDASNGHDASEGGSGPPDIADASDATDHAPGSDATPGTDAAAESDGFSGLTPGGADRDATGASD